MFDYMRSVNLVDTGTASKSARPFMPYTPIFYTDSGVIGDEYTRTGRSVDWSGQVTP